ncbi:hypothetical protein KIW84_035981 [Lathyrus oleraceus]|uniref:Putative plant transposon protein domain-containing protein n=1 Tax=Pisum sativum TaxID=3888 RepID=A0A9D5B6T1_PEA|nr:hypothetical protein KIW84_035981 [Pisum sativum]
MASQLKAKGKGKVSSSRGPLDLSRLFTTKSQQESFPTVFESLDLSDLICEPDDFYPELVKVFYSNMVSKKGKLTSVVKGVPISMTATDLSSILGIPSDGHRFSGIKAPWEGYSNHVFYYGLSRLSEHQFYNKRKKSSGGDLPERVYCSSAKFTLDDRMLHYFLVYVIVPRYSNHCTITDSKMLLLYAIKNNFLVDWGHTILCHMLSYNEHVDGLPYAHFLTKIFHHFNVNLENEVCFSMNKISYCISIKRINWKMRVIFNHRTHEIKYLDNDVRENQSEAHSDEEINPPLNHPPSEAPTIQPSNQMIMDYLQGF